MADYGHELQFGTFITPQAKQADDVVALAQLSEAVGLDLVTFQDHPYQSNFLDTWTLLSFVAAKTERVKLAGNVLNLPLRQPTVLARAMASLDILSHGRAELGLGSGAFWDGIAGMGGEKLAPGEAVQALEEAIEIIQGIWDSGGPGGVRVEGRFHKANGARRGPAPRHRIDLWLGAYKPRMLRLVGRKADGWLPSMSYIKEPTIADSNAIIDEAAEKAGRDPREIRRLLNLIGSRMQDGNDARMLADELTALTLEHGFSTFILPADAAPLIETFAGEVVPRVRDGVAVGRQAAGTATGRVVSAAAMAARMPGIDYDNVPATLAEVALEPSHHAYPQHRSTYIHRGSPGLVLRPRTAAEVAEAVTFAAGQDVPVAVRSGGHGISGKATNDGGIVIDVGQLNAVQMLDPGSGRFRVGPGTRWGEVAEKLAPYGLGMSSGDYGDVGVGGLATAGGIGWLSRQHGLTIDHVVAAELVLADGRELRVDAENHPDLFWAVRGAGANFGIITALELEAFPVGNVVFAQITYDLSDPEMVIPRWADRVIAAPRELTSFLTMGPARGGNPAFAQAMIVINNDDPAVAEPMLQPFLEVGPVIGSRAYVMPYPALVESHFTGHDGVGGMVSHSGLLTTVTPEIAKAMSDILRGNATDMMQLRAVGGAVNDVAPEATAYAHRHQNFCLNAGGSGSTARRLDSLWPALEEHLDGLYLSFETAADRRHLDRAFPGKTLERLRSLKAQYDPRGLFNSNFPIPPAHAAIAAE